MLYKLALLVCLFLLTRLMLVLALYLFFHGREPASDMETYYLIGANPLIHYLGQSIIPPYPPLQGFLLWPVVQISSGLPNFGFWLRICSTIAELAIYVVVILTLPHNAKNFYRVLALTLLPLPVLSFTIWGQEEILSFVFIYFGILAWQRRSYTCAITILSLAVTAGKIFILPLLGLCLLDVLRRARYYDVFIGVGLLICGYLGRIIGGASGFEGAMPLNDYGNTLWSTPIVQKYVALKTQYSVSIVLCTLWACICIAYWFFFRLFESIGEMYALIFMGLFMLFYFANPEYFTLAYAALLAVYTFGHLSYKHLVYFGLLLSCTWIHNIAYMLFVSKKYFHAPSILIYPYGTLLIANLVLLGGIILAFRILYSNNNYVYRESSCLLRKNPEPASKY